MHRNADLDALGSAYYLSSILGGATIASDGLDRFAKEISRKFNINVIDDFDPEGYDEIIAVDTASREQLGKFRDVRVDAVYDHHLSNNIFSDTRVVKPEYPSCSEMLYDMFGKPKSREAAILLIGGIISDTRWFRFANSRTFSIFTKILEDAELEFSEVAELFDFPYTHGEKVAMLKGMQRLKFRTKGKKIICVTQIGAHESSFASFTRELCDVVFVANSKKESVRVTGRSKELNLLDILKKVSDDFSCTYGGHESAAGMSCIGDAEAILNALLMVTEKLL